jgi:hypothetical protein
VSGVFVKLGASRLELGADSDVRRNDAVDAVEACIADRTLSVVHIDAANGGCGKMPSG